MPALLRLGFVTGFASHSPRAYAGAKPMISSTGLLKITVIPVMMCSLSGHTFACSVAACLNHGIESNRSFVVAVRHDGKPLRGVRVRITGRGVIDGLTQNDGKVKLHWPVAWRLLVDG